MSISLHKHTCPRCKKHISFANRMSVEELKKIHYCPNCWVPYKLYPDLKSGIVSAERCNEVQKISQMTAFGKTVSERVMPDDVFDFFSRAVDEVKSADQQKRPSLMPMLQVALDDPMAAAYWDQRIRHQAGYRLELAVPLVVNLYYEYPFQVTQMLTNRDLFRLIEAMSISCPNCRSPIPKSAQECLYCRWRMNDSDANTEKIIPEQDPLKILRLRLAKGEITIEQYEQSKKAIE